MPPRQSKPGLARYDADDSADEASDPSEAAYLRAKRRLSDQWRGPVDDADDNAQGMATPDLPDDIAAVPMAQQLLYCEAYNRWMEEHPDDDDEACDAAGRAALEPRDSADAAANLEAVRAAYHADYVRRISNAWKT